MAGCGHTGTMAIATDQTHCARCGAVLMPGAAYCDHCGERTHRAKRLVRAALRVEVLFVGLMFVLVFGFAMIYYFQ